VAAPAAPFERTRAYGALLAVLAVLARHEAAVTAERDAALTERRSTGCTGCWWSCSRWRQTVPVRAPARALIATTKPLDLVGKTSADSRSSWSPSSRRSTRKIKTAEKDLAALVTERGSTLMELTGIGPTGAARPLADVGDIHRFRDKDRFASWDGTAPLDASSGASSATACLGPGTGGPTGRCTSWPSSSCATPLKAGSSTTPEGPAAHRQ
jgi:hypothetical protein